MRISLNEDGSATVTDDGRGIPVDIHPEEGVPAVELVMSKLHAGGKFDGKAYAVSGGLHGVGLSVVNALSEWTEVEVFKEGKVHHISFSRGNLKSPLQVTGTTDRRGTRISFRPDREIFSCEDFDWDVVRHRLREMAYLMGRTGMRIELEDERSARKDSFHFPEGLVAYIEDLTEGKEAITEVLSFDREVTYEGKDYGVEVALRYTNDWHEGVFSFANNIRTAEGGTHLSGFRSGLTRTLNQWLKKSEMLKKGDPPSGDDYRAGLYAVLSLKIPDPQFEGQTKGKLGSREASSVVESVVGECLADHLDSHPEAARAILRKALLARDARDAARKQRDLVRRKGVLSSGSLPGKLADCQSRDREETELYLVEGDSAGGSAKTGRDRRFQAILPLKGKIINVEKNTASRIFANQELQTMIQALGAGIGDDFDPEKSRYGKVIIMTDADVDGSHIRTLILTFLFRHMRGLIENGRVYVAQPPLYLLKRKGAKDGTYISDERGLQRALLKMSVADSEVQPLRGKEGAGPPLVGESLNAAVETLESLERALSGFTSGRRGVSASEFIARMDAERGLPLHLLREVESGEDHFYWSDAERDSFLASRPELKVWEGSDSAVDRDDADILSFAFHERDKVSAALEAGTAAGVPWTPELRFRIRHGKEERLAANPLEILRELRGIAQKQLEVQRYKGLGEMNPEQLWESTMDPERRSLKRIILDDAYEADRIFSMLMGDETEPRRRYIEDHALEVQNLDI